MKLSNPFVISGYRGPEYFCDRVTETERLCTIVRNEGHVTLLAPRRYGKTGAISIAEKETLTRRLSSEALRDYLHKAFVTTVRPDDSVGSSALVRKFKAWRNQSSHKEK